uniref:PiggyBac transposable element derived 1 n=1 Tax=Mus spicilegus TaxID=10103 RepID=A0A8C6HH72_MUSSI
MLRNFTACDFGTSVTRRQTYPLQRGDEAATLPENLASEREDTRQQATLCAQEQDMHLVVTEYSGASMEEYQSLHLLQSSVTPWTRESPELPLGCERDSPSPTEKAVSTLNTVRSCHPPHDSWAKMHIASLQYITQKGREKAKSRVIELLRGLAFSDESETEEDNEPEVQPERKKIKASSTPEKSTKRDSKPNFPSWSALDSGLLNLKSEKLNPVELFELFFDDETFNLIVNETNNYASQKNVSLEVTVQEMRCVFGVLLCSGFVRHPRTGMYWEISDSDQTLVRNEIRRDRFELIFSYLHFADNKHLDQKDKFSNLRPLIKQMKNFPLVCPPEEYYCFDKSMCECFDCDQFLNGKPLQIGYKIWCGTTNYARLSGLV